MRIAVLTSGGVDSSVALMLLREQGHDVTAFYLKIWLEDELKHLGNCPWEEDLGFVRQICDREKIPLEIMPLQKEYFETVVAYAISEVKAGRTPNPDIMCNNHIKFGLFFEKIGADFEKVASGHYAQVVKISVPGVGERFFLKKSPDPVKDQTYFLARLSQKQLSRIVFPIGIYNKEEVRALAVRYHLPNNDRKDSQGICFLGKVPYREFIRHYLGEKKGDLVEFETGQRVGEHEGSWYYTLGQRKGIRLSGGPWYVVSKDSTYNKVYVSKRYHEPDKQRDMIPVSDFYWFSGHPPQKRHLQVKLRHGEHAYKAVMVRLSNHDKSLPRPVPLRQAQGDSGKPHGDIGRIRIKGRDQGIAPGQFAVFYDGEICLGSAVMK
ncbi:tRNA 2-thiouridine(34) synthase MnmA [Candidatus Peregrinibacteria bacterium]|nr:tRNA 2-thiouridine(34) synthase MnmA [Candidatus Peregrinibacteria bacterium]